MITSADLAAIQLQAITIALEAELSEKERQSVNVDRFVKMVQKHTGILHEMIEKIVIHAPGKSTGKRTQQVYIHYSFGIGI